MLSNVHSALNCVHLLAYLLKHPSPHKCKCLCCLTSDAGTSSREKPLWIFSFSLNKSCSELFWILAVGSLVLRRFSCVTTGVFYTEIPQNLGTLSISKHLNRVGTQTFARILHFAKFLHKLQYLKTLFDCVWNIIIFPVEFNNQI